MPKWRRGDLGKGGHGSMVIPNRNNKKTLVVFGILTRVLTSVGIPKTTPGSAEEPTPNLSKLSKIACFRAFYSRKTRYNGIKLSCNTAEIQKTTTVMHLIF